MPCGAHKPPWTQKAARARIRKTRVFAPFDELRPNSRKHANAIGNRNISFFSTAKVSVYPPRHQVANLRPDLEGFVTRIGVAIQYGGDRNSYNSSRAESRLPGRATFVGALASTDTPGRWLPELQHGPSVHPGFEAMLWLRKGFGFASQLTVH